MNFTKYLPITSYFHYAHEHDEEMTRMMYDNVKNERPLFKGQGKIILGLTLRGIYSAGVTALLALALAKGCSDSSLEHKVAEPIKIKQGE